MNLRPLLLVGCAVLAGCATAAPGRESLNDPPPLRLAASAPDSAAEAYYHYSVAQLDAQAGRFKEAIAELQESIKRDRKSTRLNSSHIQKSRMPSSA